MATIVISYRREDTGLMVGRICDRLRDHYGADQVIMDIDSIPLGLDFRKHLRATLDRCDTMLAVIGPSWAALDEGSQSRLADETDWVRIEIEAALAKDIPVIPVLINGAGMPKPRDLPDMMKDLAFRQATEVDMRRDFHSHMDRLIRVMDQLLAKANSESAATDAEGVKAESDKSGEALTEQQEAPRRKAVEATKAKTGTPPRRALKDGSEPSGGAASDLVWVASVHAAVLEYRTWFNILGIVLVSLGVVAIVCAVVSTAPAVLTLLLAIVGIVQIGHALATRQWCGFPLDLIIGVLYLIVAGLWDLWPYIPALPASGALSLMFIIQGMLEAGMAYRLHPHAGWVWMLLAGIVALAVGVLGIFARGVAAIAICLAITLITSGIAYLLVPLPTRGQA